MGNGPTCVGERAADMGICYGRPFPPFKPPNTNNLTYAFDFAIQKELQLSIDGKQEVCPVSSDGFKVELQKSDRITSKLHMVREYTASATNLRLQLSGRVHVQVEDMVDIAPSSSRGHGGLSKVGTCVFRICTRGCPIYESVKTKTFTHTAQVTTSGVYFALFLFAGSDGLYLCPKIQLVLMSGDEVDLVSDKVGPLQGAQAFFMDFAVLDDGGRNVQMDLIFRGHTRPVPGVPAQGMRTVRTCLQDYTGFNNAVQPARIAFGYSNARPIIETPRDWASIVDLDKVSVHLQNLVISEESCAEDVPETLPFDVWNTNDADGERQRLDECLKHANGLIAHPEKLDGQCAGLDSQGDMRRGELKRLLLTFSHGLGSTDLTWEAIEKTAVLGTLPAQLPMVTRAEFFTCALKTLHLVVAELQSKRDKFSNKILFAGEDARTASMVVAGESAISEHPQYQQSTPASPARVATGDSAGGENDSEGEDAIHDFWYHMRYSDDENGRQLAHVGASGYVAHIRGEFWLSKKAIDKKNVYFHCSSTFVQALTMCISLRFSCPMEYLSLIERATKERDAAYLLRDVHIPTNGVILGFEQDPRHRGLFRMFFEHRNEIIEDMVVCEAQSADVANCIIHQEVFDAGDVIIYRLTFVNSDGTRQQATLQINARRLEEPELSERNNYAAEEPSTRFPTAPCLERRTLSPTNRIFVYSNMAYQRYIENFEDAQESLRADKASESFEHASLGSMSCGQSECTAEDWQSAGGGMSDGEPDAAQVNPRTWMRGNSFQSSVEENTKQTIPSSPRIDPRWRRPLMKSSVLMSRLEEQPFKCFPGSLS